MKHHSVDSDANKIKKQNHLESQDLVSDAVEEAQEGLVLAMVEQFERNTADFLQGEFVSDNPF